MVALMDLHSTYSLQIYQFFQTEDFQRRYASKVIELANINRDLNEHIRNIQDFTQQVCCIVFATGAWTGYALGS